MRAEIGQNAVHGRAAEGDNDLVAAAALEPAELLERPAGAEVMLPARPIPAFGVGSVHGGGLEPLDGSVHAGTPQACELLASHSDRFGVVGGGLASMVRGRLAFDL